MSANEVTVANDELSTSKNGYEFYLRLMECTICFDSALRLEYLKIYSYIFQLSDHFVHNDMCKNARIIFDTRSSR